MFFKNKTNTNIYNDYVERILQIDIYNNKDYDLYEKTVENISLDIKKWFEHEVLVAKGISNLPRQFYQQLRNLNMNNCFSIQERVNFLELFKNIDGTNIINRFFILIDQIYLKYPSDILMIATKKFLLNIAMREKSSDNTHTYNEVVDLINNGCCWIWLLPLYQYVLTSESL